MSTPTVTFLLSKHPYGHHDGETALTRILMEAAATAYPVRGIALTAGTAPPGPVSVEAIRKPPLSPLRIVPRAALRRRSAIHVRFAPEALVEAIRRTPADRLVARRLYMMEAALEAGRSGADAPAAIVEVFESEVLRRRGGMLGAALRPEARRTARDERRCMREARSLVALGDEERAVAETVVGTAVPRLDVAFPPAGDRPRPTPAAPVALFLGDRRWAPNAAGLRRLYRLWPEIRERVRAAELLIVGVAGPREPSPPEGARASGFVDDLAGVWGAARVMLAPLPVGGGVRVKVLEAAARGVPVVGSPAALGSISSYLDLPAVPDDEAFVARAAELLADRAAAERAGATLWEANARHVAGGGVERAVVEWLGDGA